MRIQTFILALLLVFGACGVLFLAVFHNEERHLLIETVADTLNRSVFRLEKEIKTSLEYGQRETIQSTLDEVAAIHNVIDIAAVSLDGKHIDISSARSLKGRAVDDKYKPITRVHEQMLKHNAAYYISDFNYYDGEVVKTANILIHVDEERVFGRLVQLSYYYAGLLLCLIGFIGVVVFQALNHWLVQPLKKLTEGARNNNIEATPSFIFELSELSQVFSAASNKITLNGERLKAALALNLASTNKDQVSLMQAALDQAEQFTNSKIAYLHFVNDDQETIRLGTWSTNTRMHCQSVYDEHYPISHAGIWVDCFRQKKPVIHNDYASADGKKGLPEGHIHLLRHMSVPIINDGKVVSIIGVGNKDTDYDEDDLHTLELMAHDYWTMLEQKKSEDQLKLAASVYAHAREGIIITDVKGNIVDVNDTFLEITGYSRAEVIGQNPRILSSGQQSSEFYASMWSAVISEGFWSGEIWNRRKSGEIYPEMLTISSVSDEFGAHKHYVALFTDISNIKQHEAQLERMAHYDVLTGLPNRALLADRLGQAMLQCHRHHSSLAVVFLDLDGFKNVNDTYGHSAGDELLVALSQRMKAVLRDCDTLARIGGDEFVLVLADLSEAESCIPLLERLLDVVGEPFNSGNKLAVNMTVSMGVTTYPQDDVDADQLMRHADQAMYVAKQRGKNRYHFFDMAGDSALSIKRQKIARIQEALVNGELTLYYQPKVNMITGHVVGMEALIRWEHPERGLLAPAEFLPVIEGHATCIDIGEWVIDTALTQIAAWQAAGLVMPVSVNLCTCQLQQPHFLEKLKRLLSGHPNVNPQHLEFELLETGWLGDMTNIASLMNDCSKLGISFALDDFGTGYSSLTYLRRLPANLVKIDQSFVRDMLTDPDDLAIVDGVIGLSQSFRRAVIAEGVETIDHGKALVQLGCDLGQGYGISRPMPADQVSQWVATWNSTDAWRL